MNLAFIVDPVEHFKIAKDSTYAMMVEAADRGHTLSIVLAENLRWERGVVRMVSQALSLRPGETPWYRLGEQENSAPEDFSALLLRKDPPFDMEYLYLTILLELAERQGALVINRPGAVRDNNEKLAIGRFPHLAPPTLVTSHQELLLDFIAEEGEAIIKPLDAMGGHSIFRVRHGDPNSKVITETMTRQGRRSVMIQRYLPEIREGDKRILLIGGEAVPHALARIPPADDHRGNLAAGGTGVARPLTERDRFIAAEVGPWAAASGLDLVGLDVIGDFLTEINVTSPTCFQEIRAQTDFNVAAMMIDTVERKAAATAL